MVSTQPNLPIPPAFNTHYGAACEAIKQGRHKDAEHQLDLSAKACPEVWIGLGCSDLKESNWKAAFDKFERALTHTHRDKVRAVALNNMGMCLERMGDRSGAFKLFQSAYELDHRSIDAMSNIGLCLTWQNKPQDALRWFNKAITRDPCRSDLKFSKAMALLVMGNMRDGLPLYEHRAGNRLDVGRPHWNGQPLDGQHILVYCEQGAGDTIQMARYLPQLKQRGAKVSFCVQKGMRALFRQWDWLEAVYEPGEEVPKDFDYVQRTMSLPLVLNMPKSFRYPYLNPTANFGLEGDGLKVGISWGGSLDHKHDFWRSTKLEQWKDVLSVPGVTFYSLQVGERVPDLKVGNIKAVDLSPWLTDYQKTANAIAELDLVISVDTSIVHLAGAMGKKVWMLTPFAPDWRWQLGKATSTWYPSLTLFRQLKELDWKPVFESVATALHEKASM